MLKKIRKSEDTKYFVAAVVIAAPVIYGAAKTAVAAKNLVQNCIS